VHKRKCCRGVACDKDYFDKLLRNTISQVSRDRADAASAQTIPISSAAKLLRISRGPD
jgi:hypothetical protein